MVKPIGAEVPSGLTISFPDEIPVFSGNEISVDFGRNLLNFETKYIENYRNFGSR
jgi:hypothetical protein